MHKDASPAPARTLANDADDWQAPLTTLGAQGALPAITLVVIEATGAYWQGLAMALHTAGWGVSVVPPASVRDHARSRLRRAKTDALNASLLVDYARRQGPTRWTPSPPEIEALQLLLRQRDDHGDGGGRAHRDPATAGQCHPSASGRLRGARSVAVRVGHRSARGTAHEQGR